jgi:hypothetical protein
MTLRPIYQAPTLAAAEDALAAMEAGETGQHYPAIPRTWRSDTTQNQPSTIPSVITVDSADQPTGAHEERQSTPGRRRHAWRSLL